MIFDVEIIFEKLFTPFWIYQVCSYCMLLLTSPTRYESVIRFLYTIEIKNSVFFISMMYTIFAYILIFEYEVSHRYFIVNIEYRHMVSNKLTHFFIVLYFPGTKLQNLMYSFSFLFSLKITSKLLGIIFYSINLLNSFE